ncbi:MAG: alanine racemase [Pseudomonadales bacterium]|nr:alanine racemase [Pseudomonadales bacterium]
MPGRLTVSTGALARNYGSICASTDSEVAGVVKANGYGIGVVDAVQCLEHAGCKTYFVATLVEGIRVRQVSPGSQIYVLEGLVRDADSGVFLQHQLRPVINSPMQLSRWNNAGSFALHIDTGMERLGLSIVEGDEVLAQGAKPSLVLSHFARADEPSVGITRQQIETMLGFSARHPDISLSLSNSAGALLHDVPEVLVRAGIALYGGSPTGEQGDALEAVVKLSGDVIQVRDIEAGTYVGYGGTYQAAEKSRLVTVGIGYADGLPRLLSNCGRAWWRGDYYPLVGRASMDLIHVRVDLSVEVEQFQDETFELIGANVPVDEVARQAQTLSYEVLTGLDAARRLERVTTETSI